MIVTLCVVMNGRSLAQVWTVEGPFRDEFIACIRNAAAQVECSIRSSYTGTGNIYYGATYFAIDSAAYSPDSKRFLAVKTTINGNDYTKKSINVAKNKPVTVTYTFDYPKELNKINLLFLDTGVLKNIPIQGSRAPVSTPKPANTPKPTPTTNNTAQPTTAPFRPDAFDIKLTGCQFNAQGGYSCSGAEISPIQKK